MKLAVVGAGYWGPNLVRNLVAQQSIDELIVCDKRTDRLSILKQRFPRIKTTGDFDAVVSDNSIDGVLLATPISSHCPLGLAILNSSKHLFVEKPLAGSVKEAQQLVDAAEAADRVLMVGHTFEYSPAVLRTKQIIQSGDLGRLYFISMMRVNLGLHQRDASVIWDLAPHDFSILFHWLQETPERISGLGRDCIQKGIPDVAFLQLTFPSGVVANLEVAWLAPSKLRRTAVVGERKMLVYDDTQNIEKVKLYDQGVDFQDPESFGEFHLSYRTGDIVSPRLPSTEPLRVEMEHFLECIREKKTPKTDGQNGLRVVRALEAAERSIQEGQPISCPAEQW